MNKNKNRNSLFSAVCAAVLAVTLFTGCGNSDSSDNGTSGAVQGDLSSAEQGDSASAVIPEEESYTAKHPLTNPNATVKTQKVYDYICESFGKTILTCQQESTWKGTPDYEILHIEEVTGKTPAMRGLDFMNNDFDGVVKRAIEWDEKGGLVTICWHTGVRSSGYNESQKDDPDFEKLLTEGTDEYKRLMTAWDKAANALLKLQEANVPVLWRPFHEFDGKWFWWGKGDGENFIKLWQLMYDKFTNEYGLNNLIWVLGYSGDVKDGWYPGNEYCDVVGSDTYDNSTHKAAWKKLEAMDTGKPLAFHECGKVPTMEQFESDGCMWSWFMIWHTDHIMGNDPEVLKKVYNSEKAITLDELPEELFK